MSAGKEEILSNIETESYILRSITVLFLYSPLNVGHISLILPEESLALLLSLRLGYHGFPGSVSITSKK